MSAHVAEINIDVFRRYAGLSLPRHVSYPMPSWWHEMDALQAGAMWREADEKPVPNDLSLYLHIPFCEALCKFCACNRIVQRKTAPGAMDRKDSYVVALDREIGGFAGSATARRPVRQIHWGGGSPTYLSCEEVERLHKAMADVFSIAPDAEVSMEIDPRTTTPEMLRTMRRLGFNRVSMGVQDFDEQVQQHVHRVQPFDMVRDTVAMCRELGFTSVNFDLIYGMPYQTPDTIRDTVEQTIKLSPDRVAYYHYAQIPEKIATQRGMDYTKLPDSETKLEMFMIGLELFEAAGYEFIGLDHFAKPDEGLATATEEGSLQRNFQGMTTGGGLDLLGLGTSSISHVLDVGFLQNVKDPDQYVEAVNAGGSPIERGKRFTFDDRVRQAVINQLYCHAFVKPALIEAQFDIQFSEYFSRELEILRELEGDGLVTVQGDNSVEVSFPLGRVLMRNVAAVFDAYLDPQAYKLGEQNCFSKNA